MRHSYPADLAGGMPSDKPLLLLLPIIYLPYGLKIAILNILYWVLQAGERSRM